MKDVIETIREAIPQIIATLVATTLLSISGIVFKNVNSVWLIVVIIGLIAWILCIYYAYKRDKPKIELHKFAGGRKRRKGPYTYPKIRPWALWGTYIIPFLAISILGYYLAVNFLIPPSKTVILVADFDSPDTQRYRVTETIVQKLSLELEDRDSFMIQRAYESFYESSRAREVGEKRRAAIVIWGWYGVTDKAISLSVNFDIMDRFLKEYSFCPPAKGEPRIGTRSDLERYTIQTDLSSELSYLVLFATGLANYVSGNYDDAIYNLSEALEVAPDETPAWPKSNTYHLRGEIYSSQGIFDLAIDDFSQAIEIRPDYAELYFDRAEAYIELENYEAAVSDWGKYISYVPDDIYVLMNLGSLNFYLGNFDEAADKFSQGLKLDPESACGSIEGGYAHYLIGDYDNALHYFDSALNSGYLAEGYFGRGLVSYIQKDYEQAITDFTKSIEETDSMGSSFPAAHEYRGYAYAAIGDVNKAEVDLLKFLEITSDPDENYLWFYRGYEEQAMDNVERELQKLGVGPNSP